MEIQELAKDLFQGREVRILGTREEPLFVANDIGAILEIKDMKSTLRLFDDTEKGVHSMHTLGGNQQMTLLTEKGLYKILFTSRKKEAKVFQDWVFRVIKEIRLKGRYVLAEDIENQQLVLEQSQNDMRQELEEPHAEIEVLKPIGTSIYQD